MEYKEFKPVIIATIVMIAMLGALCIATPAMAEGHVTVYIDTDGMTPRNPVIEVGELICFNIGYESNGEDFTLRCDDDEWGEIVLSSGSNYYQAFHEPGYYEYSASYTYMNGTTERTYVMRGTVEVTGTKVAIAGCDDLDQSILRMYDEDGDGWIDDQWTVNAAIDLDNDRITQSGYDQVKYAYEHNCPVESIVTPTPTPTTRRSSSGSGGGTTSTPSPTPTAPPKFRVGPTVTLRPVNDVISTSENGIVELYMNNPTLNDVTLTADVQVGVPSGVSVSGEGFGYGSAAGMVAGTFTVPPGTVRTININIKGERAGVFTIHFTGLYWADDDKDGFQQVSLTHQLTVTDPDANEREPVCIETNTPLPDTGPINDTESDRIPITYIVVGMGMLIVLLIIVIAARK